jgi:amino acid transporter
LPETAPRQPARGSREPKPSVVFGPGFGVTLMLAFGSYVGFEAAALYGEEAANPKLSVPRATFIALGLITVFYLVTTWAAISASGVDQAQVPQARTRASSCSPPTRSTLAGSRPMRCRSSSRQASSPPSRPPLQHRPLPVRAPSRRAAPPRARAHPPVHGSPAAASAAQLTLVAIIVTTFALAGQDPYLRVGQR